MNATRVLAKASYGVFGLLFLAAGASVLLVNTNILPVVIKNFLADESGGDLHTLHLMQEFGALLVFSGLVSFWFLIHYELSRTFHWSMTLFWGLIALVHWFDVRGATEAIGGPLFTTIPFALFALIGLLRMATERGTGAIESNISRISKNS